ncbi:hypothetical protein VTK73DRAFT_4934 [Phialemonium thermophilum]|uniref:C6 finger domain protein n=1 Tax=Phialemonium thermophilum TaxID=223376 RepID=A0ABR3V595_9PEZI
MARDGDETWPPIIHPLQATHVVQSVALANCYTLVRMWVHRSPGSEAFVADALRREMERLVKDDPEDDLGALAAFQAYFLYCVLLYFVPLEGFARANDGTMITLHEMAFRTARKGLVCAAEEAGGSQPAWESWIVAATKRRAIFSLSLFDIVYNAERQAPTFVSDELRDAFVPEGRAVWQATTRAKWQREYARYWSLWEGDGRGAVRICELWTPPETGARERRDRIDRWVEVADEFGMMLFALCVHIHGY